MPSKLKAQKLTSTIQFTATLDEIAALTLDIDARVAALNKRLSEIEVPEKAVIEELKEQLNAKLVVAEAFAESNADELLPTDRKSAETAKALWGFRQTPPSLKQMGRAWTQARSIEALQTAGAVEMLRTKTELDKDAIKATWANDPASLSRFGFVLEQRDEFWVEPKRAVETAAA